MIVEIVELNIAAENSKKFEDGVNKALPLFKSAKGFLGLELIKSQERISLYRLIVRWETREDHVDGFQKSEAFGQWRALVGSYFAGPPIVDHSGVVLSTTP